MSEAKVGDELYPVYVFHAELKLYGTRGLCFKLPAELSSVLDTDRRNHLWFVELFHANEEHTGVKYMFHKFMRTMAGYDCVPIPLPMVDNIEDVQWTVVISPLSKYMLKQYDGFVYPDIVLDKSVFDFYTMLGI